MTLGMVVIGLALFLYGMAQLEQGIRSLGYNTFKRWLSRSTASPLGSAGTGVFITAILQSSSMVSLLVLAFASAQVLPLYNAVGILLGANLGTTVTGWIVATIGFKLSLQTFALPLMATGALLQLFFSRTSRATAPGLALFGLGLIIFGLDIMKDAVDGLPAQWDLGALQGHGMWVYFLAGTAIAALIQSSSAAMMITLAALHAGLIDLQAAAALVIGADLGTTSTTVLGSIGGSHIKRQLALAHFLFNAVVDLTAFLVLLPLLPLMQSLLALQDPLYSLVAFHSIFNLLGLLVFLPILKPWSIWLNQRFRSMDSVERPLVGQPTAVPDAALVATGAVLRLMRLNAVVLNLHNFRLRPEQLKLGGELALELEDCFGRTESFENRYARVKQQESDLLAYSFDLQEEKLEPLQVALLTRQNGEARAIVYAAKTLKDIRENLVTLRHSEQSEVSGLYEQHGEFIKVFYHSYLPLTEIEQRSPVNEDSLQQLLLDNERHYEGANAAVRLLASADTVSGSELSTMLNVNRDIHHALKDLVLALR